MGYSIVSGNTHQVKRTGDNQTRCIDTFGYIKRIIRFLVQWTKHYRERMHNEIHSEPLLISHYKDKQYITTVFSKQLRNNETKK